jgi:protein-tyrosine-phosphatase
MGTVSTRPQPRPTIPLRTGRKPRTRIAFVCYGNSCRSQMAEAWVRQLSGGQVEAVSAGVQPLGFITPETFQVMEEKEISLAGQGSKGLDEVDWKLVEVMVNMSPMPTPSLVPEFGGRRVEWEVTDPFGQPLSVYREVRDHLEGKVQELLAELKGASGGSQAPPVA